MERGQNIIRCPNCGENKVKKGGNATKFVAGIVIFIGLFIPIIGWFAMLPVGLIFYIVAAIREHKSSTQNMQCVACKHLFEVSKDTYEEYKAKIN